MSSALDSLADALKSPPPWLIHYAPIAHNLVLSASSVAEALNLARDGIDCPVRFVEQAALPADEAYESFIARTATVPTRDNLHDLFNGLAWLSFPQTKRRLNLLHAEQISLHGTSGARGRLRDAMTLFDENAAILQAPATLVEALRARDWHALFITHRALWNSARWVLFGHALLEKLMQPRKPMTAHVWLVEEIGDASLAASLTLDRLREKTFLPLPVLGIPGWWPPNEDAAFYDDADVFRPRRA